MTLNLYGNSIGDEGAEHLSIFLQENKVVLWMLSCFCHWLYMLYTDTHDVISYSECDQLCWCCASCKGIKKQHCIFLFIDVCL